MDYAEKNTGAVNVPGEYKDPKSGASLVAQSEPQADALARLGWELQSEEAEKPARPARAPRSRAPRSASRSRK